MSADGKKLLDDAIVRLLALFTDIDAVPTSVLIAEYVRCLALEEELETQGVLTGCPAPVDDQKRIAAAMKANANRIAVEINIRVPRRS